jgi:galactan endo-1,6-beta-galactosidase
MLSVSMIPKIRQSFVLHAAFFAILLLPFSTATAEYTVTVHTGERRGVWEGWGCSLSWWGNSIGTSDFQDTHVDLFFTTRTVKYLEKELPGLGMNIVRYNVGGGGRGEQFETIRENVSPRLAWYKDIDGFWINWFDRSPGSSSWDWSRDANQRSVLQAACKRGVTRVEFFSNAPMWWMMDSRSSDGGRLQPCNESRFAYYIATVAKYARSRWKVKVGSVSPFNEPSAYWWDFPCKQEGCGIPKEQQKIVLGYLRAALDAQGLNDVQIAASDENSIEHATTTLLYLRGEYSKVGGRVRSTADWVDKLNVHAYNGLKPWRDNKSRIALRKAAGNKRIWMSEYGDSDASGMELARTIMEDLNFLQPCAWVYWQPVEPRSAWGLVNADYGELTDMAVRGKPTRVNTKYFVFAQFSRFLREGYQLIGTDDYNSIAAYDAAGKRLILITLNNDTPQLIRYDLRSLTEVGDKADITYTRADGKASFVTMSTPVVDGKLTINASANTVYSIVVNRASAGAFLIRQRN